MALIRLQGEDERQRGIYYQLDSADVPIGAGGMGQVFKGLCVNERTKATRPVAIKFMFDDLPSQAIERARREASIQLRNDNLVEMLGFIEIDEHTPSGEVRQHFHVVSELLTGVSLSDLMAGKTTDRDGQEVPYAVKLSQDYRNDPEHFARTVVMNVLSGLMALHDAGYIHRDIDPSNIMVTSDGHIKLIDFGIAKQMNTLTTSDKSLTVAGKFMGKPEYAAPELALGDIQHQNQTTDIYAMGILLYQCIVGHTPFEGARHEILEKQLKEKLPLGVVKNKALRGIIATACQKKQELRYQTSAEMRVALETMNPNRGGGMTQKTKIMLIAAAAALVVVLGIVGILAKTKSDAADEQAAQVQAEQAKSAFVTDLNSRLARADQEAEKALGTEHDVEGYGQMLMNAYEAYHQIEVLLTTDNTYGVQMPEVAQKQQRMVKAMHDAVGYYEETAAVLLAAGESGTAEEFQQRAAELKSFLETMDVGAAPAADPEQTDSVKT
ncbi:MAG: serine/threonine protein kinase [Bacteroidaceae bacterium]|nr:serine/threonine protein kinase [Bacteroidaceae bacterium]